MAPRTPTYVPPPQAAEAPAPVAVKSAQPKELTSLYDVKVRQRANLGAARDLPARLPHRRDLPRAQVAASVRQCPWTPVAGSRAAGARRRRRAPARLGVGSGEVDDQRDCGREDHQERQQRREDQARIATVRRRDLARRRESAQGRRGIARGRARDSTVVAAPAGGAVAPSAHRVGPAAPARAPAGGAGAPSTHRVGPAAAARAAAWVRLALTGMFVGGGPCRDDLGFRRRRRRGSLRRRLARPAAPAPRRVPARRGPGGGTTTGAATVRASAGAGAATSTSSSILPPRRIMPPSGITVAPSRRLPSNQVPLSEPRSSISRPAAMSPGRLRACAGELGVVDHAVDVPASEHDGLGIDLEPLACQRARDLTN